MSASGTTVSNPNLPELDFTATGIRYEGTAVPYDAIEAITFELLPLLRNRLAVAFYGIEPFMPIGSSLLTAKLALHLIGGETIWISRGWDRMMLRPRLEALCVAAECLAQKTFDRRFRAYLDQFDKHGRFSHGRYDFYRSGDILKGGRWLYNVYDEDFCVALGDYHIHFEGRPATLLDRLRALMGDLGHTVKINRNRDCFLSMYQRAYGTRWEDELYRDLSVNVSADDGTAPDTRGSSA